MPFTILPPDTSLNKSSKLNIPESLPKKVLRNTVRGGARIAESILGFPVDIAAGIANVGNAISGGRLSDEAAPSGSGTFREVSKAIGGQYLEPQSPSEEKIDEWLSLFGSILNPSKGVKNLAKTATRAGAAVGAKDVVGALGGGPLSQAGAQILALSLPFGSRGALKNLEVESYKKANNAIEKLILNGKNLANISGLKENITKLYKPILYGTNENKKYLRDTFHDVWNSIKGHVKIDIRKLWDLKKDVNSKIPNAPKVAQPLLKKLVGELKSPIEKYANQYSEFGKSFQIADELHTVLNRESTLGNILSKSPELAKKIDAISQSPITKGFLFGAGYKGLAKTPKGFAATILGGIAVHDLLKFASILKDSPAARKEIGKLFAIDLPKQNIIPIVKNIEKIAQHYEKKSIIKSDKGFTILK